MPLPHLTVAAHGRSSEKLFRDSDQLPLLGVDEASKSTSLPLYTSFATYESATIMLVALLLASLALAPAARGERPTLPTVLHSCYDIPDPLTKTFVPVDCLHAAIAKRALDPSGTAPAVSTVR